MRQRQHVGPAPNTCLLQMTPVPGGLQLRRRRLLAPAPGASGSLERPAQSLERHAAPRWRFRRVPGSGRCLTIRGYRGIRGKRPCGLGDICGWPWWVSAGSLLTPASDLRSARGRLVQPHVTTASRNGVLTRKPDGSRTTIRSLRSDTRRAEESPRRSSTESANHMELGVMPVSELLQLGPTPGHLTPCSGSRKMVWLFGRGR